MTLNKQDFNAITINELMHFIYEYRRKHGQCPECGHNKVKRNGKTIKSQQRYLCLNDRCGKAFISP